MRTSRCSWMPRVTPILVALMVTSLGESAVASPTFPPAVQDALGLACTPGCSICHIDNNGGPGRLNGGDFVNAMLNNGLAVGNPGTVASAIEGVMSQSPPVDSDGDGVDDVMQLEQGRNPVTGDRFCAGDGGGAVGPPPAKYGCGARIEPRGRPDPVALGAGLLAALGFVALRRRRAKRR